MLSKRPEGPGGVHGGLPYHRLPRSGQRGLSAFPVVGLFLPLLDVDSWYTVLWTFGLGPLDWMILRVPFDIWIGRLAFGWGYTLGHKLLRFRFNLWGSFRIPLAKAYFSFSDFSFLVFCLPSFFIQQHHCMELALDQH